MLTVYFSSAGAERDFCDGSMDVKKEPDMFELSVLHERYAAAVTLFGLPARTVFDQDTYSVVLLLLHLSF